MRPCIKCGGTNFGEGKTGGDANVFPINKFFSLGTPLLLTICLDCREVNSMRVLEKGIFKK